MSNQIIRKPIREPVWVGPNRPLVPIVGRGGELDGEARAQGFHGHKAVDHSMRAHHALSSPKAHLRPRAATVRRKFRFLGLVLQAATLLANAFTAHRLLERTRQGVERRPQRHARSMLSEHALRDIGLKRIDVQVAAQRPFWQLRASR